MNIKVCHFTSVHPANDIRIYHKECKSLVLHNFETHLVAIGNLPHLEKQIIFHEVKTNNSKSRLNRILFRAWKTYKIAKKIDADIYHFHDPELLPYGLLLKLQGKKVIYDVHEDVPRDILIKQWIPSYFRYPIAWIVEKVENFIAKRLDKIATATPHIGERFEKVGSDVVVINNFPRLEELSFNTDVSTKNPIPTLCYVGLISTERGILEILEAIKTLEVKFILAGKFASEQIEKKALHHEGWQKVEYYPSLSRSDVAKVFAKSHLGLCLLHPKKTFRHSLPIKLFEYMAAGLPVLASNFPLWEEIINSSNTGYCVDPLDIKAIQQTVLHILASPEKNKIIGKNGRDTVEKNFNWQMEEVKLIDTYRSLLISS